MTTRIIEAYECVCDKCDYKWSSINLPATCANKSCRSPRWNRELTAEKKPAEASPVEVIEPPKKEVLSELQNIMAAVKPKSDYYTKPIIQPYPKTDQPDYYDSERSVNYD